jgi:hypothetical protein
MFAVFTFLAQASEVEPSVFSEYFGTTIVLTFLTVGTVFFLTWSEFHRK